MLPHRPALALALALALSLAWSCATSDDISMSTSSAGTAASGTGGATGSGTRGAGHGATSTSAGGHTAYAGSHTVTASAATGTGGAGPCTTHITYGDAWIHPPSHPAQFDEVTGLVSWDGSCTDDSVNDSYAMLSNAWKPYFHGRGACVIAIDTTCPGAPPCTTRITYGPAWLHPPNHSAQYDDVAGKVTWDRTCTSQGGDSFAVLSNGWQPHYAGAGACEMSLEYTDCGGP